MTVGTLTGGFSRVKPGIPADSARNWDTSKGGRPTGNFSIVTERASPFVWIDGVSVAAPEARISVFDRGFLYGDSVFETLRVYGGRPFRLEAHLERLARSAEQIRMRLPAEVSSLEAEVREAVARTALSDAYVRLTVSRGAGALGLRPDRSRAPRRVLIVTPLPPLPESHYEQGISAILHRVERPHERARLPVVPKFAHYLASILALETAEERGADDALFVDDDGLVLEGATSNLFWVRAGCLYTAPLESGVLDGITRRTVLELAAESGVPVSETALSVEELPVVDELFLTSSVRELVGVVRVDDGSVGDGRPGPTFRRLLDAYRRETRRPPSVGRELSAAVFGPRSLVRG